MLEAIADVRPEERRGTLAAFLTLLGILTGHALLETARDALFLARLPASQLPWVYLAMAGVAVLLTQGSWSGPKGRLAPYGLSLLLSCAALGTLGFWWFNVGSGAMRVRALYVWAGLVGTMTALQFWLVLGELYTITQAKRIFKLVATGSLIGALLGSLVGRTLALHFPAPTLVLAAAAVFALTALGPALFMRRPIVSDERLQSRSRTSLRAAAALVRADPYVMRLAGLVLVSTVALTLGDYVFKSAVARSVPKESLGAFFATLNLALNGLALLVQVSVLGWVMRVMGLHRALWILPALVCAGTTGLAFGGGLVAGLLLKGADGSLRYSLHRTSTELLFLPISDALRARAKPIIDVVGQRGGQALASVFILSEVSQNRGDTLLSAGAAVLCVVWIAWAVELKPLYLALFRRALRDGLIRREADAPDLDLGALEALFGALNSQDDREVIGALDLLADEGRARLIPALVLYHPSQRVVLHAFELFAQAGRSDCAPIAERLLGHLDPEIRAAALRTLSTLRPDEVLLRQSGQDPSPLVRATALVGLVSGGWISDEAEGQLEELLHADDLGARRALAQALARQPSPVFAAALLELARLRDPETQVLAAQAMGPLKDERFLPALLELLPGLETRDAAREAFEAYGEAGLRFLAAALADTGLERALRRQIPRTIARFAPEPAAAVLLGRLLDEPDGRVRYKLLRALGRLQSDHPDLALDRGVLRQACESTLDAVTRLWHRRLELLAGARVTPARRTPGHELLATLLVHKQEHATERLFRLLGLLYRSEDFKRIYRGLFSLQPKVRASSRELLENALPPRLRPRVLALIDDGPEEPRLAAVAGGLLLEPLPYETLLALMMEERDETLRCLAAYHVGELGLVGLRGRLLAFREAHAASPVYSKVLERALELLSLPPERRLLHAD